MLEINLCTPRAVSYDFLTPTVAAFGRKHVSKTKELSEFWGANSLVQESSDIIHLLTFLRPHSHLSL